MSGIFVTGSGTDVGKTFVTALLLQQLRAEGCAARALKPVISGYDPQNTDDLAASDSGVLLSAMGLPVTADAIAAISPWRFKAPLSPDMAAAREGRQINFTEVVGFCRDKNCSDDETLLVEGVGGAMVPLNGTHLILDLMVELGWPALMVTGSYLGAISHGLTTLDVIKKRGLAVAAIIVSESQDSTVDLADTVATLRNFCGAIPVRAVPRMTVGNGDTNAPSLTDLLPR